MADLTKGNWTGRKAPPEARSCMNCKHYTRDIENGEYGSILSVSHICELGRGFDSLPSFPFRDTKCRFFERAP